MAAGSLQDRFDWIARIQPEKFLRPMQPPVLRTAGAAAAANHEQPISHRQGKSEGRQDEAWYL